MTRLDQQVALAAERLRAAWVSGRACEPVRTLLPEGDVEAAYAVQDVNTRVRLESGRRLVGRKIGLTSRAVQKQLGVDQPDYGMLFDDMDVPQGEAIPLRRVLQPKVEAEVAFVMREDLDDERLTSADVIGAVDYAVAAIEVVGSRIAGWDISLVDTVADNASSGLFVLGHQSRSLREFDVQGCGMRLYRGDEVVSVGSGAACLGSPVSAALWLAKVMARRGRPLRKGDIVLTGALGPMVEVRAGDVFRAEIEGLGAVRVEFEAE